RTVIAQHRVPPFHPYGAGEGTGEDHITGAEPVVVGGELVREPGHAGGGVVEHGGGDPGFLDGLVPIEQRGDPAQVNVVWPGGVSPIHHRAHCRVVTDRVDDRAPLKFDPRGKDLQGGNHVFGRSHHVEHV